MKSNTKYSEIFNYLCSYINKNDLKNGDKLPTEFELAEEFGASRVTVRRAIKELVERNMAYKVQGGGTYVGPLDIQSCIGNFGVPFITSYLDPDFGKIISGAENYLFQKSCYLTVHCSNQTPAAERKILKRLIEKNVKSIIITPVRSNHNNDLFRDIIEQGINLIFVDVLPHGICGNCVSSDNISIGYCGTKHLLDKGYRNIALFCNSKDSYSSTLGRENGYRYAIKEAGLPLSEEYICYIESLNDLPEQFNRVMSLPAPPDAFFCCNDILAINLRQEILRHHLSVPEDIGIVGVDNSQVGALQPVPLTSVAQDFYAIGQAAAELCLEKHKNPSKNYVHQFIPVSLVERNSAIIQEPK